MRLSSFPLSRYGANATEPGCLLIHGARQGDAYAPSCSGIGATQPFRAKTTSIAENEAYTSLGMLLRFAAFVDTEWSVLTM